MASRNAKALKIEDLFGEEPDWFQESYLVPAMESIGVEFVLQKWSLVPYKAKRKIEEKYKAMDAEEAFIKKFKDKVETLKDEIKWCCNKPECPSDKKFKDNIKVCEVGSKTWKCECLWKKKALLDEVFSLITKKEN
ncbi:unnamed protein product [Microthlaspi erraticum]|uniref:Glabrous enhancer-binding protein-like C-terminal domain-containing protein n=1 Tax=Microthlaspi erraticum TaxID=1685480 RepID=A0A6D2IXR8_9BRAS|nr:unnamed protein product [Microthlaspi erraticum]